MLDNISVQAWPLVLSDCPKQVVIQSISEVDNAVAPSDDIWAITDGWVKGRVAAVLRGGANARAVLDLLAQSGIRDLNIFHIEEKLPQLEEIFLSTIVSPAHSLFENVTITWRHEPSLLELVRNVGKDFKMLFFGAPLTHSEIMPLYEDIKKVYAGSVTIVRGPVHDIEFNESDEIYKWVRQRTFDAADFSLPSVLRKYKKKCGHKIAIVLPSLNEEKTVGNVIKAALEVKEAGVIDEVLLVDSVSTDSTVEIAKSFGVPVYLHPEVKPELGSYRGKGEAMFKSVFLTDADIIAWVDTDIESITPRFFYGLLGPLLTNPQIRFVKGYFSRPIRVEANGLELGGGRVTEILARPWINTFLPELSGYIQPLAGTVAIYRDSFLKMRIPVNYGVEIAMLIQAVKNAGLWSTCQVNLGEVIHKSKDVNGLSEMATQILQVLAQYGNAPAGSQLPVTLRRVFSAHGDFEISLKQFNAVWRQYQEGN